MKFDVKSMTCEPPDLLARIYGRAKILVDGTEIKLVWFADTEAGIVKGHDVLGDGLRYASSDPALAALAARPDIEMPPEGVASIRIRGKVEIVFLETGEVLQ